MQGFEIEIRHIRRSKRATIRVLPGKRLRVSVPWGMSQRAVSEILQKKSDWILKTHEIIEKVQCKNEPLFDGSLLPFLGETLELRVFSGFGAVVRSHNELLVPVPPKRDGDETFLKEKISGWYKEQMISHLQDRCSFFAEKLGVCFKSMKVRNYRSRWGACSSRGDLVFNWQIATFTPALFDYIVAHEICHLKELNHSARFYAHLSSLGFERRIYHRQLKNLKNIF